MDSFVLQVWKWAKGKPITSDKVAIAFGVSKQTANVALRNLYRTGAAYRKEIKSKHGKKFVYTPSNHPPPGMGGKSLANKPIIMKPENFPLLRQTGSPDCSNL